MKTLRLLIADDHGVVRQGVREIVRHAPGLAITGEAVDGDEALRLALTGDFDLMILDISLPGLSGTQVLHALRDAGSSLPVLFFTMHPPVQYADYARRQGAQGILGKDVDADTLLNALFKILGGGTCFPSVPRVSRDMPPDDPFAILSERETEVMAGLLRGDTLDAIAQTLGIGPKSVTTYRRRLLDKLGARSNVELAALAARHGRV
jgi:DNA-binding NarL/FixJ family response regulator